MHGCGTAMSPCGMGGWAECVRERQTSLSRVIEPKDYGNRKAQPAPLGMRASVLGYRGQTTG